MFCAKCGKQIIDNAKFCGNCGHAVSAPREAQSPPPSEKPPMSFVPQNPAPMPNQAMPTPPQPPKKGGKTAIIIASIAVMFIAFGVGGFFLLSSFGIIGVTKAETPLPTPSPTPVSTPAPTPRPTPESVPAPTAQPVSAIGATIAAGHNFSFAIQPDGTLWAWGWNDYGQLGDGTFIDRNIPVQILDDVVAVTAGMEHALAIKSDGSLWAWGYNGSGQLGNGTLTNQITPIRILDDVTAVSAGAGHSLAIRRDGSLWAWGENFYGKLGDGTESNRSTPVQVLDDVISVSAGDEHSLAIKSDGSLWAWGDNYFGQIGDGTTIGRSIPIMIMEDVTAVSAGSSHSMAIRNNGSLWTWGGNGHGQLGNGTFQESSLPVLIMDDVAAVSAGSGYHVAAIRTDGSLWVWGENWEGQLGLGDLEYGNQFEQYNAPMWIMDNVTQVSAGSRHTIAATDDGSLWAWGDNWVGQLGDGTFNNRSSRVQTMNSIMPGSLSVIPRAQGITLAPPLATPSPRPDDWDWDDWDDWDWDEDDPFWWVWGYIIWDSDQRYLEDDDISWFTPDELRLARNEIFARHGRLFDSPDLQDHFDRMSWYNGHIAPANFSHDVLNSYERANIELILEWEARH